MATKTIDEAYEEFIKEKDWVNTIYLEEAFKSGVKAAPDIIAVGGDGPDPEPDSAGEEVA
jgi:hypothetical protein